MRLKHKAPSRCLERSKHGVLPPRGRGLPTEPQEPALPEQEGRRERKEGLWKCLSVRGTQRESGSGRRAEPGQGHRDGGTLGALPDTICWFPGIARGRECRQDRGHRATFPPCHSHRQKAVPAREESHCRGPGAGQGAPKAGAATQLPGRSAPAATAAAPAWASERALSPGESAPRRARACASPSPPRRLSGPARRQGGARLQTHCSSGIPEPARCGAAASHTNNGIPSHPCHPRGLPSNFLGLRLLVSMATWKDLQLWFFGV